MKRREPLGDLEVHWRIILRWFVKEGVKMQAGFVRL
jgi:hypothetical protein